jgi:hypothetical protein
MKKLPIGIQSIKKILSKGDYVYVDKTGFVKKLIDEGSPHYFLSRPRRFGKSLFLNTLGEIFKGNKKLFKGYQIYESDYDWKEYPVLHFDFAQISSNSCEDFKSGLKAEIERMGNLHETSVVEGPSIKFQLKVLIESLSKKNQVVVLVDEYDSAIINNLKNLEVAEENRNTLKAFFETLKSLDDYLKFTFITGVSKFSQVSLFSGPNNLTDITMDPEYAGMMGYTEEELRYSFGEYINTIAKERSDQGVPTTEDDILDEVRTWYNGYRFSRGKTCVYNPFSTLKFIRTKEPMGYWYSSGTPSFLIDHLKKQPLSISTLSGTESSMSDLLDISSLEYIDIPALMFQTGYLTIKEYDSKDQSYKLDFPNREVREAFYNSLIKEFTRINPMEVKRSSEQIRQDLKSYQIKSFIDQMNVHFSKISYQMFVNSNEGFFQAIFFTFLEKSGIHTTTEVSTNIGRIDLVSEMPKCIYIFELKLDKTAESALDQACTKKYKERYSHAGKEILLMGINFSSKTRNISEWKGELFSKDGEVIKTLKP